MGRADVAFLTARLRAEEGICTAADLTPTIDRHRCSRVGDTYQDFPLSFSGEAARASLSAVAASLVQTFDRQSPGATDTWGSAALHVYAASADTAPRHTAFVTGILAGEPGPERIVEAWTFEFDGSNWRLVAASVETHPEQLLRETTPPFRAGQTCAPTRNMVRSRSGECAASGCESERCPTAFSAGQRFGSAVVLEEPRGSLDEVGLAVQR